MIGNISAVLATIHPAARGLQSRAREAAGQRPGYCANAGLGSGNGIIGSIAQRGGLWSLNSETLQGYDEEVRVRLAALRVLATGDGIHQVEAADERAIVRELIGLTRRRQPDAPSQLFCAFKSDLMPGKGRTVGRNFSRYRRPCSVKISCFRASALLPCSRRSSISAPSMPESGCNCSIETPRPKSARVSRQLAKVLDAIDQSAFDVEN